MHIDKDIAREAKSLVVLAFRNGPIEDLHAGETCEACKNKPGYSKISDPEIKKLMKRAVDQMYRLLMLKRNMPEHYEYELFRGSRYARLWDEPEKIPPVVPPDFLKQKPPAVDLRGPSQPHS
jgi:hypothetical protein